METKRIKRQEREVKCIPTKCSWCNRLLAITDWEVPLYKKTGTTHGICIDCYNKILEKMYLPIDKDKE